MRILSSRVLRARRNRPLQQIEAVIALLIEDCPGAAPYQVRVPISAPIAGANAAALRHRLYAGAKLRYFTAPERDRARAAFAA